MHIKSLLSATAICGALATSAIADPVCNPGAKWAYTGTAKGTPTVRETAKGTVLEFAPAGANAPDSIVFSSANEGAAGVYQLTADIDVTHLSADATVALDGATSAAVGRSFDVTLAAGDGGSSGFSRPITATGAPFTVMIKTQAKGKISLAIRNYVSCKLR